MRAWSACFTVGRKKCGCRTNPRLIADAVRAEMLTLVQADVDASGRSARPTGCRRRPPGRIGALGGDQEALRAAADVPAPGARLRGAARRLPALLEKGNRNLVSDVGVAARLCAAACECAWLNVEVNLAALRDKEFVAVTRAETEELLGEVRRTCLEVWEGAAAAI